ncbi:metallophosphoesterase [Peribacillus sp. NJ4]|uniref:metallophosphoesterase n=1 Tax=Peribacillus sp. NJ4 TaxID=3055862 RepID=UPI0025A17D81|nr:metallophosphoesterase [Peribacillus sp. NJ4]MDM5210781.1 metallophosphoesterase [Peribacillus sp. NJ4]
MKDEQLKHESEKLSNTIFEKGMDRRSFLEGTTKIAGLTLGLSLVNSLNLESAGATSKLGLHKNPDLVFPVISDVHILKSGTTDLQKWGSALHQLNELVPKQDALVVVGDLTENGYIEEYDRFMSIYDIKKQPKAVSMIAIGNHDYWNGLSVIDSQKRFIEKTGMESIYYHKVVKGYHFIVLGTEDGKTEGTFSVKQIEWLGEQLKLANTDDAKKPIFVFHHQPIKGTIYGSEWGFSANRDLFYDTLKEYPQVITFSGHTHYPLDEPRTIHQKDFTTLATASLKNMWVEAGYIQGELPKGAETFSQGLIVEVHGDKVFIHRRDFTQNDWIGEPWVIDCRGEKNSFKYTEMRDQVKPRFPKGSSISIVDTTSTEMNIMFNQANDNSLVHSYKVVAKNNLTGQIVKEFRAFSEFYKDPVPNPFVQPVKGLQPGTSYSIEVYAIDSFGNISDTFLKIDGITKA